MGKSKPPEPKANPQPMPTPPENPNANEEAKAAAGAAKANEKRRSLGAQSEGSFGRSKEALAAAPSTPPTLSAGNSNLKSTLGG